MAGNLIGLTAEIVASYVVNNTVAARDLPALIKTVHGSLTAVDQHGASEPEAAVAKATRAKIRRSITDDAIISFENGKPYRTMKRHLARHGLTPDEYRAKWGLPEDYPIVAPSYSAARSKMAKSYGFGRGGVPAPAPKPARTP